MDYNETTNRKGTTMFSDIFVNIAIFLYTYAPVIAIITIALIVLNEIRKVKVARRARRVQARREAAKTKSFNTFETL